MSNDTIDEIAPALGRIAELERAFGLCAVAMAKCGHDFTDNGYVVIIDREKDAEWRAEELAEIEAGIAR